MKLLINYLNAHKQNFFVKILKKIFNLNFIILIRNSFKIFPINIHFKQAIIDNHVSTVSDCFLWRTDNGFKTKFKFSDLLKLFYNIDNSYVEFHFYSKDNCLIKVVKFENLKYSNEIIISKEYLDGVEDYGVFYIFHHINKKNNISSDTNGTNNILSNRCYLGYSKNDNLYSFVHGNVYAKFTTVDANTEIYSDIIKTSFFKNNTYVIQKYFDNFDMSELAFSNPTSKKIVFTLEDKNFELNAGCSLIVAINSKIVKIKSNCMYLRPSVFSYKDEYFDVHHS